MLCFYFLKTYLTVEYLQYHQSPFLLEDVFQKCLKVVSCAWEAYIRSTGKTLLYWSVAAITSFSVGQSSDRLVSLWDKSVKLVTFSVRYLVLFCFGFFMWRELDTCKSRKQHSHHKRKRLAVKCSCVDRYGKEYLSCSLLDCIQSGLSYFPYRRIPATLLCPTVPSTELFPLNLWIASFEHPLLH